MKKFLILILFFFSVLIVTAQSSVNAAFHSCEATVICAFPQLLTGTNISPSDLQNIITQARNDGIILANGTVNNREALAERVLIVLRRTEIIFNFGSESAGRGTLIGYIFEMSGNNSESHYILAGTNRMPLFNPCNISSRIISFQEVYVNAR